MANADADPNTETTGRDDPLGVVSQITTSPTLDGRPMSAATEPALSNPEAAESQRKHAASHSAASGSGLEGEEDVWEARYSLRNFIGRFALSATLLVAWLALAIRTWPMAHQDLAPWTVISGLFLLAWLLWLGWRVAMTEAGHYYRLTTRRLFVSTGVLSRRRDQIELLRVEDVYTRQNLIERWVSVGTVIVVSSEKHLPMCYLVGVREPKHVMDLIWHHARSERDQNSSKINIV